MALYAEITLRSVLGKTRVDVDVEEVHNGLHSDLWRRTYFSEVTAERGPVLSESWLWGVLAPLVKDWGTEILVVDDEDQDDEGTAAATAPLPIVDDQLEP